MNPSALRAALARQGRGAPEDAKGLSVRPQRTSAQAVPALQVLKAKAGLAGVLRRRQDPRTVTLGSWRPRIPRHLGQRKKSQIDAMPTLLNAPI